MLNEQTIYSIKAKIVAASEVLNAVLEESIKIEGRERDLNNKQEILRQKEVAIKNREAAVENDNKNVMVMKTKLDEQAQINENRAKEIKMIEDTIEKKKLELIKLEVEVNAKLSREKILNQREDDLKSQEESILKDKNRIVQEQSMIEKEKMILRDRKEKLDLMEKKLREDKERVKKFLEIQ